MENSEKVACKDPHSLFSCLRLSLEGQISPTVFSLNSTTVGFVILTKGTIMPTSKGIYKYSVCWCNWHKTQTAPWVSNFSFHTSTFQITTSRITRNSSKFLALGVLMIPAGMQKRLSFFPLKIMYFLGTVQILQMRQMKDLFWTTSEKKTCPLSDRAPGFSYNI